MSWPYEEYTLLENLFVLVALFTGPVIVYFIIFPIMIRYQKRRSEPIEEGTDGPDDEYWDD